MEILDFKIPHFVRISWASALAQDVWAQRLYKISAAWQEIEWRSVVLGVRQACILSLSEKELKSKSNDWAQYGLQAVQLEACTDEYSSHPLSNMASDGQNQVRYRTAVADSEIINVFLDAFKQKNHVTKGLLLGYPECCTQFFEDAWTQQGITDMTVALTSALTKRSALSVNDVHAPFETNVLWRSIGIRAVPHLPCSLNCASSVHLAGTLLKIGRTNGYVEEMDWLEDVLDWPVQWSCLHGIAEIKTPILRISTETDATPAKVVLRSRGNGYPKEGAVGIHFPYQPHLFTQTSAALNAPSRDCSNVW